MIAAAVVSISVAVVAVLAWDFGRRWLALRSAQLTERTRLDAFEATLATYERGQKELVKQLQEGLAKADKFARETNSKASLALEKTNGRLRPRRF